MHAIPVDVRNGDMLQPRSLVGFMLRGAFTEFKQGVEVIPVPINLHIRARHVLAKLGRAAARS